ncbi:MAG: hypothetical protein JW850_11845 [Thermoflexales bacterium]|nr:hypothetical protein [Thermoflexales bacterium]
MPQLVKGGKWIFGWVVVGPRREIPIPPEAYHEYGFQAGESVLFLRGSRRSGGFSVGRLERVPKRLRGRVLGHSQMGENEQVVAPPETGVRPGSHLLVGRGSGVALGFLAQGPIYAEALKHPELGACRRDTRRAGFHTCHRRGGYPQDAFGMESRPTKRSLRQPARAVPNRSSLIKAGHGGIIDVVVTIITPTRCAKTNCRALDSHRRRTGKKP